MRTPRTAEKIARGKRSFSVIRVVKLVNKLSKIDIYFTLRYAEEYPSVLSIRSVEAKRTAEENPADPTRSG